MSWQTSNADLTTVNQGRTELDGNGQCCSYGRERSRREQERRPDRSPGRQGSRSERASGRNYDESNRRHLERSRPRESREHSRRQDSPKRDDGYERQRKRVREVSSFEGRAMHGIG